jgi:hypothetical protein
MGVMRSPWTRLEGPTEMHRHQGVRDRATFAVAQERFLASGGRPGQWECDMPADPRVNHGRWIVDCVCGNGASVSHEWREARCFACGAVYRGVAFPANADEIERVLVARPNRATQNWRHETVDVLRSENMEHGVTA